MTTASKETPFSTETKTVLFSMGGRDSVISESILYDSSKMVTMIATVPDESESEIAVALIVNTECSKETGKYNLYMGRMIIGFKAPFLSTDSPIYKQAQLLLAKIEEQYGPPDDLDNILYFVEKWNV